jgi:hypothetical protein
LGERVVSPDTFATKADAQRWLAVAQADILRGTFIDPSAGRISFAEWAEDWLASKPGKRATSLARDRAALRTHLIPALGLFPLSAITPMHVRKAVDEMRSRGLSPKSIRTYVGTLVAIMNAAVSAIQQHQLSARAEPRGARSVDLARCSGRSAFSAWGRTVSPPSVRWPAIARRCLWPLQACNVRP